MSLSALIQHVNRRRPVQPAPVEPAPAKPARAQSQRELVIQSLLRCPDAMTEDGAA